MPDTRPSATTLAMASSRRFRRAESKPTASGVPATAFRGAAWTAGADRRAATATAEASLRKN